MNDYVFYFILIQLILLIPSFYLYRWVLRKTKLTAVKTYSYVFTILFPIILSWLFITINTKYIAPWIRSEKFHSQTWKSNDRHRYRMINDILESKILIGKTKEEVISLLGNNTEEGPCTDCIGYSTYEPDQGFSIDHEVLEINFEQNRVTSVRINLW